MKVESAFKSIERNLISYKKQTFYLRISLSILTLIYNISIWQKSSCKKYPDSVSCKTQTLGTDIRSWVCAVCSTFLILNSRSWILIVTSCVPDCGSYIFGYRSCVTGPGSLAPVYSIIITKREKNCYIF